MEAKFSYVILNGNWFWKPAWFKASIEIQARLPEVRLGLHDKAIWTTSKKGCYVSSETWHILRKKKLEIDWWKLVWFPLAITKQAFILWLVMQDRLLTRDRLIKMGYNYIKEMVSVFTAIIRLKAGTIFSLNAALAIEFGSSLCVDAM